MTSVRSFSSNIPSQAYTTAMAALAEVNDIDSITFTGLPMPFALRLPVPMSDQELIAFSRSIRPYQVERNANGELEIMSPTGLKGASLELFAGRMLGNWADEHGGVVISSQGGYTLGDSSVRMADASWIEEKRWDSLTPDQQEGFAFMSPDFLIEIRSKSDTRAEVMRRMDLWLRNGTRLGWLIDPYAEDVLIYRPGLGYEQVARPDWLEADAVVPGFCLETGRMWIKKG